ncbi:MAG: 30S ribosomal protein S14 [Candidatus Altiarchaeales archaeon A3]|nr:MAG: 30S ribosomal protein S14 [Candidatus Altiarchaeales archaeon A3]
MKTVENPKKKFAKDKCEICKNSRGLIHKHGLNICRRCFREVAESIGFKKYS